MACHRPPAAGARQTKETTIAAQVTIVATMAVAPINDDKETGTHGSKGNAMT